MEGLENNYSLKIEKNSQRISDNNATLGNAGLLPTLSASGMYSGSAQDNETKLRDTREIVKENGIFNQTIDAGVNLNWTIFQGFNVMTTYKKLKELQAQGELETRIAVENLVADITAEYYNYIQQSIRLKNLNFSVFSSDGNCGFIRAFHHNTLNKCLTSYRGVFILGHPLSP